MAIPIRLLLANGKDQIDLVAQSIDMSVDRKASAFPTPDNMLKRFAIDTNTPQIQIEVNGIFVDDEGVNANSDGIFEAEPMRSAINFGAFFPTNSSSPLSSLQHFCGTNGVDAISLNGLNLDSEFKVINRLSKNQSNIVTVQALPGSNMEFASDSTAQIDANAYRNFNSASVFSTSFNQITVNYSGSGTFTAENEFNIGDRLVKSSGLTIGDIQSISGNVITFTGNIANALSAGEQIHLSLQVFDSAGFKIGNIEHITDDSSIPNGTKAIYNIKLHETNTVPLLENASIFIDRRESMVERFNNQAIKLIPSFWLSNPDKVNAQSIVTHDSSMDSNLTSFSTSTMSSSVPRIGVRIQFDIGSTYTNAPTIALKAFQGRAGDASDAAKYDAVINLPIRDIHTVDNPALEMANRVKAAFELNGDAIVTSSYYTGFLKKPNNTFGGGRKLSDAFRVIQNGTILTFEQLHSPPEPILHPSIISADLNSFFGETQFHSQSHTPVESRKSAGDKAQDLIGLVSNSDRTVDLLRGIQIPYDSLIQSSGVTGVARNFFLTFGEVPVLDKGSASNNRPASQKMDNLLLNMTGLQTDDSPDSWFERNLKAITPNEIESLFGFLVGIGKDAIWLTLQTNLSSVNEGGIRIIPEKLHVRYDAGNNYYAYSLLLSASDFVIGV
jgi:hypothetical protein